MDSQTLKHRLLSQIDSALAHLFPSGNVRNGKFLIGNVNGDAGKSLSVILKGDKAGVWKDFSSGEKGDIYSLWMLSKNLNFAECLEDVRKFLGITQVKRIAPQRPQGFNDDSVSHVSKSAVHQYLNGRGIQDKTLKLYRIRQHSDANKRAIAFRYWTSEGEKAFVKYTGIDRDANGKKSIWSTKPFSTLFGWWLVTPHDRAIVICEGEIDAMTVYQLETGLPVLSMPSGAQNLNWIDNDYDRLNQFENIYLITDNDSAGDDCAEKISKRLGQSRVARIPVPNGFKDPNEAWNSGDETLLDWHLWKDSATYFRPPTIRTPSSYLRDAKRILAEKREQKDTNPFLFSDFEFRFRDGETTIITGEPGHGKSDFLYQSHLHEMKMGKKVMICSLEIPPAKMLVILATQLYGDTPSDDELEKQCEWLNDKMVYHTGQSSSGEDQKLSTSELFNDMEYAYKRFGVTRFIIDSLHFLVDKEDYEAQDKLTRDLQLFDLKFNVHTALVAHANLKGRKDFMIAGQHDVEGSGGMIKPIDNGITIWRHEEKQRHMEDPDKYETTFEKASKLHDAIFKVWKQRDTGEHFQKKLWFDKDSRTFRTREYHPAHFFSHKKPFDKNEGKDTKEDEKSPSASF